MTIFSSVRDNGGGGGSLLFYQELDGRCGISVQCVCSVAQTGLGPMLAQVRVLLLASYWYVGGCVNCMALLHMCSHQAGNAQ